MTRARWIALGLVAALSVLAQAFGPHPPYARWWDLVPGSYALFGFLGCVAIVVVSKKLGKAVLQRSEGYYDDA